MMLRDFLYDDHGSPAAEFVLSLPMILPLIFIAMEAGNFFWSQQKLVEAVRNGARYASRLDYGDLCSKDGAGAYSGIDTTVEAEIKNLTRTGSVSGSGLAKLPNWDNSEVSVTVACDSFTEFGIFRTLGGDKGAVVTVSAPAVPYRSVLGALGVIDDTYRLSADAKAPVIGI